MDNLVQPNPGYFAGKAVLIVQEVALRPCLALCEFCADIWTYG
jgi:hypothetical protein